MVDYSPKRVEVPAGATIYPINSAQSMLRWSEAFALERRKMKEENVIKSYMLIPEGGDVSALERAFNKLVEDNDALREVMFRKGGKIYQFIQPYAYEKLPVVELDSGEDAFKAYLEEFSHLIIPWYNTPAYFAQIVRYDKVVALVVAMHHHCSDGYSTALMFRQINAAYDALVAGEEMPEVKPHSVVKFFEKAGKYASTEQHAEDRKFWLKTFHGQPHYSMPAGYRSELGKCAVVNATLDGEDYQKLTEFCKLNSCTTTSALMSLAALTTYCVKGKTNFCIYSLTHGRSTPYLKQTFGCMMNTVPVFYDLDTTMSASEFAQKSYMSYLEHLSHGALPMGEMVPMGYRESFKHLLNFNHGWLVFSSLELAAAANVKDKVIAALPFTLLSEQFYAAVMDVPGERFELGLNYQALRFKRATVERLVDVYMQIIRTATRHPQASLEEISRLVKQS